jgi:hypothetical protein
MTERYEASRTSVAVQKWQQSLQRHTPLTEAEWHERLQVLAMFCDYVAHTPDAIIAACVQETARGKTINTHGRRHYSAQIEAFQAQVGGDQRRQIHWGNIVRSFLIHNGVMFQAGWQYRLPRTR